MADQTLKDFTSDLESGERSASRGNLGDSAAAAARDLRDKAADVAGASAEQLKQHAGNIADQASELGREAAGRLKDKVDERRGMGADYVSNLAEIVRRAAGEFDQELPFAATYIRKAASQVDEVSEALRRGDLREIVDNAQEFARRQPTAFFGLSLLAGFGIVRFLKSSAGSSAGTAEERTNMTAGRGGSMSRGEGVNYAADMGGYGDGLAR